MYNPQIFSNQTEWIAKNKNNLNIKFVSQLGDLVQSGSLVNSEWETASKSLSLLEKADIPYGIIPGNHDMDQVDASSSGSYKYNEILPLNRFNTKPWFGGNYLEYQNNYQLITAGGIDFIFMNVEVDPTDDVLKWADEILSKYKERKAVFTTHAYLQDDTGERSQKPHFRENGNPGEEIWNKVIKHNCNVFLVLSGHFHNKDGENRLVSTNDCGYPVNQVIQDYQGRENSGNGFLRIYKFYPKKHEISVLTYSTTLKKFEWDQNSRFILKLPF
jgi:DNA repair exonuclease SbcCD nuclease subunit